MHENSTGFAGPLVLTHAAIRAMPIFRSIGAGQSKTLRALV
jgi:hypothetical protein